MPPKALRELCLGSPSWQQIINQSQLSENAKLEWDYSGQAKRDTLPLKTQTQRSSCRFRLCIYNDQPFQFVQYWTASSGSPASWSPSVQADRRPCSCSHNAGALCVPLCLRGHDPHSQMPSQLSSRQLGWVHSCWQEHRIPAFNPRGWILNLAPCAALAPAPKHQENFREGKQMYLKEGDIGKAESEEVVPVKTETEAISQAGSIGRSPGSGFLAPASGCQDWVSGLGARTGCQD